MPPNPTLTNKYWASFPPEIRALRALKPPERAMAAWRLVMAGFSLDPNIHDGIADPVEEHRRRAASGYTWILPLSARSLVGGSGTLPPGVSFPGNIPAFDPANPPAGAILTLSRVTGWHEVPVPDADPTDGPTVIQLPSGFDDSGFEGLAPNNKPMPSTVDWVGEPIENFPNFYRMTDTGIAAVAGNHAVALYSGRHREDGGEFIPFANMAENSLPPFYWLRVG